MMPPEPLIELGFPLAIRLTHAFNIVFLTLLIRSGIEILGGHPNWDQASVTYENLLQGESATDAFNTQMISDVELSSQRGSKTYVTLSRPVMQRLLEGRTKGLIIRPLGALVGTFYASESTGQNGPKLHFSTKE